MITLWSRDSLSNTPMIFSAKFIYSRLTYPYVLFCTFVYLTKSLNWDSQCFNDSRHVETKFKCWVLHAYFYSITLINMFYYYYLFKNSTPKTFFTFTLQWIMTLHIFEHKWRPEMFTLIVTLNPGLNYDPNLSPYSGFLQVTIWPQFSNITNSQFGCLIK